MSPQTSHRRVRDPACLLAAGFISLGFTAIWLMSVAAIVEFRGVTNDVFLRGGRFFIIHYHTKWKGHKGSLVEGERIIKETETELVFERRMCAHCGAPAADNKPGARCEQCGGLVEKNITTVKWEPPGGWKFSYLGLTRAYPYLLLSFDPREMVRSHSTGWVVNIPAALFIAVVPVLLLVIYRVKPRPAAAILCRHCSYELRGNAGPRCPECGMEITGSESRSPNS